MLHKGARVAWVVALEAPEKRHAEEIGETAAGDGSFDHAEHAPVGRVHAPAPARPLAVVGVAPAEGGALQHLPMIEAHAIDHAHLVAVLEVSPDSGEVDPYGDTVARELRVRADAREHEKLRRVEGAAGQDHLP